MYYGSNCNQNYPNYTYAYPYAVYPGYQYGNNNNAIIIVLFILLVIIIGSRFGR